MKLTKKWFERYGAIYEMDGEHKFRYEIVTQYYVFMGFGADTKREALESMYELLTKSMWDEVTEIEEEK